VKADQTRRGLHGSNAALTLALLASGLLIAVPDLRGFLVGGYGREILDFHLWCGAVMLALPLMALGTGARPLLSDLLGRLRMAASAWRGLYVAASFALSLVAVVSGIVVWAPVELPLPILDASLAIHTWSSWGLAAAVAIHIVAARRRIVARVRTARAGGAG
jgi:cytochrome b subunit of formate dehydrogenase